VTLLAPGAAIIAGAIALPVLIILHLLRLRRRPVRVSSTLLWESAVRDLEVNVPWRWIRATASLLMQALAVLALVLAVGRAAWRGAGDAGGAAGRVLIVIDASASMSALDGRGPGGQPVSRLEEAKARARALVQDVAGGGLTGGRAEVTIARWGGGRAGGTDLVTAPTRNRATLIEAIDSIAPTDQPGDHEGLFRLLSSFAGGGGAGEQGEGEGEARAPTEVAYVIWDGAPAPAGGARTLAGLDVRAVRVGPARDGPSPPGPNAGITAIDARRDPDDPASVRLFLRVAHTATEPASAIIRVSLDGEPIGATSVALPGARPDAAGEASATVLLASPRGGVVTATIATPGTSGADVLASDDSASVVLAAPRAPRVVVVAPAGGSGGSSAGEPGEVDPYLRAALRGLDAGWTRFTDPRGAWALLNAGDASPDVVIYDRVIPTALPRIPSISLGASIPVPGLRAEAARSPGGGDEAGEEAIGTRIIVWNRRHPILRHVPLDTVFVAAPLVFSWDGPETAPGSADGSGPGSSARATFEALAEGRSGPLIALLNDGGVPRLVVGFEQARANWGPSAAFPIFIANAIDTLARRGEGAGGRWTGTVGLVEVAGDPEASAVEVRGPITRRVPRPAGGGPPVGADAGGWSANLGVLDRAGLYALEGAAGGVRALAVNLCDAGESSLATGGDLGVTGEPRGAGGPGAPTPQPGEIWPWLVLAALGLLTADWVYTCARMRA